MTPVCRISSDRRSYGGRQQFGGASETKSPNGNGRPSRSHAEIFGNQVLIATEDMKGACCQVPLCLFDVRYTAVLEPS